MSTAIATAPAAEPVHSVTVNGVSINSSMTPFERHNAVAKAMGGGEVARPAAPAFGPQGHPHTVVPDEVAATAKAPPPSATGKTPPSPQELEASRAARIAEFDADMVRQGLQKAPQSESSPEIDTAGIEKLSAAYKSKMHDLERSPASEARDRVIAQIRAQYHEELHEFMTGRRLSESRKNFQARTAGESPTATQSAEPAYSKPSADGTRELTTAGQQLQKEVLEEYGALTPAEQSEARDDYNAALVNLRTNAHGMAHVSTFPQEALHGYRLPVLIPDQHYSPDTIHDLAWCRANGISQQQLDAYVARQMRELGLVR